MLIKNTQIYINHTLAKVAVTQLSKTKWWCLTKILKSQCPSTKILKSQGPSTREVRRTPGGDPFASHRFSF